MGIALKLLKSYFLILNFKFIRNRGRNIKLHTTIIVPAVLFECETWFQVDVTVALDTRHAEQRTYKLRYSTRGFYCTNLLSVFEIPTRNIMILSCTLQRPIFQ
jgi:hypothetical protein